MKLTGITLLFIGMAGFAFAGGIPTVPEIDPAMGAGTLALLSGAFLVIRARRMK